MDANELRIGNWIHIKSKNADEDIEVVPVNIKDIHENNPLFIYTPIPLNEEWLLKVGFEKKNKNIRHGNGQDWTPEYPKTIQIDYVYKNEFTVRFEEWHYMSKQKITIDKQTYITLGEWYPQISENTLDAPIDYLHQLQNVFHALTGEELAIK